MKANRIRQGALLISRSEVVKLLTIDECIPAVESAFRMYAEGKAAPPGILGVHVADGAFHIKAGAMKMSRNYFVAKTNANFPGNPKKSGLPTIQGIIVVNDADDGRILALIDSIEISILRTGAATGVAARYLSRKNSKTLTICGCGNQGRVSARAIRSVRQIDKIYAHDIEESVASTFAAEMSAELGISVEHITDIAGATRQSDIVVTCTPSRKAFLTPDHVRPGTFVAAVGTDNEHKQEIEPALLAAGKVVTDLTEQSATIGDLHHALVDGILRKEHVHAELGEVVAGTKTGRTNDEEIIIFDSTGMALQDVAASAIVYEKAVAAGFERTLDFSS